MKHALKLLALPLIALALPSCSMNPLFYGYRSAPGVPKREAPNPNPNLIETSMPSHNAVVDNYSRRGFRVIGYGDTTARHNIDAQNGIGWTALHIAANNGNIPLVQMLLDAGWRQCKPKH
jgi:ankyrin repeat protein